jgi:hypothetical protein
MITNFENPLTSVFNRFLLDAVMRGEKFTGHNRLSDGIFKFQRWLSVRVFLLKINALSLR